MKIALIQEKVLKDDVLRNLRRGIELCREAKRLFNPDLVVFPEMW